MAYSLGKISKSVVTASDPMLDTREINSQVTDVANEYQLSRILGLADRKKVTKQPVFYTFVNEPLMKQVTVGASGITGSGTTTVSFPLTAGTSGILQKNDILMFHGTNEASGAVTSVTTSGGVDTVTVQGLNSSNITVTAGDVLSNYTAGAGENSISPKPFITGNPKRSNKVQKWRISSYITDVQNVSAIELSFGGEKKYLIKDQIEKKLKLEMVVNAAFWGGDLSDTSYSDTNPALTDGYIDAANGTGGGAIQTTRGIDKYTLAYGTSTKANSGSPNGTVSLPDMDAHLDAMTAKRAGREYSVFGSKAVLRGYDKLFKNLPSASVSSVRLVVDGNEIDFTVQKVTYGGYELNFAWMPIFDNPSIFSNYTIGKSAYFVPMDKKVKVQGGGYDPAIQVRYMPASNRYSKNDLIEEIHYGANSPINPNGRDAGIGCDFLTTQGLEVLGADFFAKQQILA